MTGKTHQIIGLCAGLGFYLSTAPEVYNPATLAAVTIVSSLGALLPDIDSPTALIWNTLPFFGHLAGRMINPLLQHRNLTHSLLGFTLVGYLLEKMILHTPSYWGINILAVLIAGLAAYASHLLADMVTVEGIPLLFPLQRMFGLPPHPFQGLRIETGKWFENFLIFPAVNLILVFILWSHWPMIQIMLFK